MIIGDANFVFYRIHEALVEIQPMELKIEKSCLQYQMAKGIASSVDW